MAEDFDIKQSEQNILNNAYDKDFKVLVTSNYGYDGVNLQRMAADAVATKITVVSLTTYVAIAAPGTAQSTAKWQCKKIVDDGAGTTVITWADGNANFDNVATDLTALTYS